MSIAQSVRRQTLIKAASRLSGLLMAASLASAMTSAVTSATTSSVASVATADDLGWNHFGGPVLYVPFGWAEPYDGATLDYEWGSIDNNPARPHGVAGGFKAGVNWQNGSFVYGGEADINFSAANDTFAPWQFSNPWFGTARGRAGIAVNNVLLFRTAGLAYGELSGTTSGNLSESHTSFGWVAGFGAEIGFAQHWSAKAEWLYLNLDDRHFSVAAVNSGLAANLVRLGLNYRF
jgi:outer membrane immunogenic protein